MLSQGAVRVALQPVVDARSRKLAFHECLFRAAGDQVSTAETIKAAERLGFDAAIDHAVARRAVEFLAESPQLRLSINVSGQTACDQGFAGALFLAARSNRATLSRLIVEITETAPIADLQLAKKFAEKLRAAGVRIAIDDFGAGHTSFATLAALPVDIVKIDGHFIRNIASPGAERGLFDQVLEVAASRKLETVAEWVETDADADYLQARGVTYLQGRLFGMPELVS